MLFLGLGLIWLKLRSCLMVCSKFCFVVKESGVCLLGLCFFGLIDLCFNKVFVIFLDRLLMVVMRFVFLVWVVILGFIFLMLRILLIMFVCLYFVVSFSNVLLFLFWVLILMLFFMKSFFLICFGLCVIVMLKIVCLWRCNLWDVLFDIL